MVKRKSVSGFTSHYFTRESGVGFTLIELLIVVGILIVLFAIAVLLLNPGEFTAEARDSQRISDLKRIDTALSLAQNSLYESLDDRSNPNIVYVSLPDINSNVNDDCKDSGEYPNLPALATGWQYRCASVAPRLKYVDGNGWLPVNFNSIAGNPLKSLPVDPVNDATNYYTFSKPAFGESSNPNSYTLSTPIKSEKYLASYANNAKGDGGKDDLAFETRPVGWIASFVVCGDPVTFTYKGSSVTYGTVTSQGKCWLNRNLGASQVATVFWDSAANGDLFQWGRLDDGHQTRTSGTTTTLSTTDVSGHSNFIYGMASPYDWRSPQNNNLWQGVNGINNPCPSGWRIPTSGEWNNERLSWSSQGSNGAFASPLKLTTGGQRNHDTALIDTALVGVYWSSTALVTTVDALIFQTNTASVSALVRAYGESVRCIKD